jgi:hypothetical protein
MHVLNPRVLGNHKNTGERLIARPGTHSHPQAPGWRTHPEARRLGSLTPRPTGPSGTAGVHARRGRVARRGSRGTTRTTARASRRAGYTMAAWASTPCAQVLAMIASAAPEHHHCMLSPPPPPSCTPPPPSPSHTHTKPHHLAANC